MGRYFNPDNGKLKEIIASKIYVDKTELVLQTNELLHTNQKYMCISRPRRFGKSMAVAVLAAYYSRGCDSKEFFKNMKVTESDSFEKHLNKYDVIMLNMQEFLSRSISIEDMIERVNKLVMRDIKREYPKTDYFDDTDLIQSIQDIYEETKRPFVVIIDEWDCVFRDLRNFQ